ncbi:coiled-coil domain-containing protein [Legionella clemsonensis]|uniref:Uncharacterized protein n=1 Tax=Legionella clemsonensis TaxID=1867846 RepID=A0A222P2S1_9GAMM|nr:hypothetical protein [Legionella clemsonensis]ASQ46065.1 hypothetical protein clem_07560 [Legionella clemsonensis]
MPKPNDLTEIFTLLQQEKTAQPHYFLFLLGTDTVFTERPTITLKDPVEKKSYERGETLSYAAQVVVRILGEEAEITKSNSPLSYCSPSVDVVNGPTTLGSEVGERIAQGVFLALRALASGKKTIQISAHSRGAVESILVMHELKRIQTALEKEPQKPLFDILSASPCNYTRTAIGKFFKNTEADSQELRAELLKRLQEVKVNSFLIDPVPGGGFLKIPGIAWKDERFFERPACNNYELLLYRDERTRCFTPIVPNGMQPLIIPGHHGSASGNRYTQQLEEVSDKIENRDTTTIQDLVLCKLFHFFHQSTGIFAPSAYNLNLEHNALDGVLNLFLEANESDRYQVILKHYLAVEKNNAAYLSFADGSYAYLGAQYTEERERFVHNRGNRHDKMRNVAPQMTGSFVNTEHAMLFLRDYIQLDRLVTATPDRLVKAISNAMQAVTAEMVANRKDSSKLLKLVQDEHGRKILFDGLSICVDLISQKYLRNHLTAEEAIKLREVIQEPFEVLNIALTGAKGEISEDNQIILRECKNFLQNGLKRTIETHYHSILEQVDELDKQINIALASPEEFQNTFDAFVRNLNVETDETGELKLVKQRLQSLQRPVTIEIVKNILSDALDQIRLNDSLSIEQKGQINALILQEKNTHLGRFFEERQTSTDKHLADIEQLYILAENLKRDYSGLNKLLSPTTLAIDNKQLHFRCLHLIHRGAMLLKERQVNLRQKPASISQRFFDLLKSEAIALGAPSPEIADLTRQTAEKGETIAQLEEAKQKLQEELKSEREKLLNQEKFSFKQLAEKLDQKEEIRELKLETEQLLEKLQSAAELKKATLINEKLIPLADDYLQHLLSQAIKLNPELETHDIHHPLPAEDEAALGYNNIKEKFNAVHDLKQKLADSKSVPLASERIEKFKAALPDIEAKLGLHRDSAWKRFVKGCLVILGVIATGVVPGVGLFVYSKLTSKSPSFFSTQTRGSAFIEECQKLENSLNNS